MYFSTGKPSFSAVYSGGLRIMNGGLFLDEIKTVRGTVAIKGKIDN